jgi:hypothetical protein
MPEARSNVGPERIRIDMDADWEVSYWTRKLGISRPALAEAISQVGNQAHEIVVYFRQRELMADGAQAHASASKPIAAH